jgi:poly(glycerol-phosphate) alpha-glucosyltransferase
MRTFIHLTSWLSSAGGGIPPVIRALTAEYRQQHLDCVVAGVTDSTGAPPAFPSDWPVLAGRIAGPTAFGYSPELARQLRQRVRKDSVIHVHGLWMYPGWLARKLTEVTGAVRIISPHGMLAHWALQNSRWKKRLASCAFERQNLRTASCLHALCAAEADNFRDCGLKNSIAIIPNGIDIPNNRKATGESQKPVWEEHIEKGRRILLYLGRIHQKKGLVNLLKAWAQIKKPEWILAIAGWDQEGHQNELQKLASELRLLSSVIFLGPQFGEAKSACYRECDAFILPSFSEGLPMVVLEAWSYGKPVLMTSECNLTEGFAAHAALRIEPRINSIAEGLRQLFEMSDNERQTMGQCGLALVKDHFTWPKIAVQMQAVYAWALGEGPQPECVTDEKSCR